MELKLKPTSIQIVQVDAQVTNRAMLFDAGTSLSSKLRYPWYPPDSLALFHYFNFIIHKLTENRLLFYLEQRFHQYYHAHLN